MQVFLPLFHFQEFPSKPVLLFARLSFTVDNDWDDDLLCFEPGSPAAFAAGENFPKPRAARLPRGCLLLMLGGTLALLLHLLFIKVVVVLEILLVGLHLLDLTTIQENLPNELRRLLLALFALFGSLFFFPLQFLLLVHGEPLLHCSQLLLRLPLLLELPLPPVLKYRLLTTLYGSLHEGLKFEVCFVRAVLLIFIESFLVGEERLAQALDWLFSQLGRSSPQYHLLVVLGLLLDRSHVQFGHVKKEGLTARVFSLAIGWER